MKTIKNLSIALFSTMMLCFFTGTLMAQNTDCCDPTEIRSDHQGGVKAPASFPANTREVKKVDKKILKDRLLDKKNIKTLKAKQMTASTPAALYTKELVLRLVHENGTVRNYSTGGQLSVNNINWDFHFNGVWSPGPHTLVVKRVSGLVPSYQRDAVFASGTTLFTGVMPSNPSGIPFYSMQNIINNGHIKNGHYFAARVIDGNGFKSSIIHWVYTGQSLPFVDVTIINQTGNLVNKLKGVDLSQFAEIPNINPELPDDLRKSPTKVTIKRPQ